MEKAHVQKSKLTTAMVLLAISATLSSPAWGANSNLPVPENGGGRKAEYYKIPNEQRMFIENVEIVAANSGLSQVALQDSLGAIAANRPLKDVMSRVVEQIHAFETKGEHFASSNNPEIRTRRILLQDALLAIAEISKLNRARSESGQKQRMSSPEFALDQDNERLIRKLITEHLVEALSPFSRWNDTKRLVLGQIFQVIADEARNNPGATVGQVSYEMQRRLKMSKEMRDACK